jgi:hypothetical protein
MGLNGVRLAEATTSPPRLADDHHAKSPINRNSHVELRVLIYNASRSIINPSRRDNQEKHQRAKRDLGFSDRSCVVMIF